MTILRAASRWLFAVSAIALLAFASPAQATPAFLSAINISDPGQDGFEPDVAVDPSGNVIAVWTRSDGTNFRIQYSTRTANGDWTAASTISDPGQSASNPDVAIDNSGNALVAWSRTDGTNIRIQAAYRPFGGAFTASATISDAGFDATKPAIDFDNSGKALLTWQRFDGAKLRVQATTRTAGTGGVFANETTLSPSGQDGFNPQADAGPNVDANGVIAWTRSDGVNLRVQSSRRRDVVGTPRPKSASPTRVALVPAFNQCTASNRVHGPPLTYASCNPPIRSSSTLTVGTVDANGAPSNSVGSLKIVSILGNTATEADEADISFNVAISDVRNNPLLTDYTGRVLLEMDLQITDNQNAAEQPEPGTTQVLPFQFAVQCVATADTTKGSTCNTLTTADAILPGAVTESKRTMWQLGQIIVKDAGPNGTGLASCPPTCGDGDETEFMRTGIFIP